MSQKMSGIIPVLCLLFLGAPGFGQEMASCIRPAGLMPVMVSSTEWPNRVRVMQDYSGGAYVFCIDGERLRIFKADGQGGIEDFQLEGMPKTIENVRSLEVSGFGSANYSAFIGREGQTEAIYVVGIDFRGNPRYFPVPETRTSGTITAYRITAFADGSVTVYFLTAGRLYRVTGIGGPDIRRQKDEISAGSENTGNITAFDLAWNYFRNVGCIWFTAAKETGTEVNFCITGDNRVFTRVSAGIYPEAAVSMMGSINAVNCTITSGPHGTPGTQVELYRVDEGGLEKEASFMVPVKAERYFDLKSMGILIEKTGNDGVEMIYGVSNERRGLPVINPWFEIDSHSIPDFYYTREDGISLFYRKSRIWHSIRVGADGKIVKTDILTDLKENSKILSVGGMAIPEVYFIGADDDVYGHAADTGRFRLTKYLFRKSGSEWVFGQNIPVPADIETTDYVKSGWVNKCMFLVFNTGEGLALFRIEG